MFIMERNMTHNDWVFEAITYRRHVGADLGMIRSYVSFRETRSRTEEDDLKSLTRLERAGKIRRAGKLWLLSREALKVARGPAIQPEYQPEDPWILLALFYSNPAEGSSLDSLIGTADYINHAIPTYEELFGALNRLQAAGLIKQAKERFAATPQGARLYRKAIRNSGRRILERLSNLDRILKCPSCGIKLRAVRWRIKLTEEDYQIAMTRYVERTRIT
jgi:hypothetical protein